MKWTKGRLGLSPPSLMLKKQRLGFGWGTLAKLGKLTDRRSSSEPKKLQTTASRFHFFTLKSLIYNVFELSPTALLVRAGRLQAHPACWYCFLTAGCGGGYDFFSALPLFMSLQKAGAEVHLSNLTFSSSDGLDCEEISPGTPL